MYRKVLGHLGKYEYELDSDDRKFYLNGKEIVGWKKNRLHDSGYNSITFWLIRNAYSQICISIYAHKAYGKISTECYSHDLLSSKNVMTYFILMTSYFACLYFLILYKVQVVFKGY